MNNQFDELAKGTAQSLTRRGALKKFGLGLAGIALAWLGLPNKAQADRRRLHIGNCDHCNDTTNYGCDLNSLYYGQCVSACQQKCGHVG